MTRLGSWQQSVLAQAIVRGVVSWSEVQPHGAARSYAAGYRRSFLALSSVPGVSVGAYGPRGGLAIRFVGSH